MEKMKLVSKMNFLFILLVCSFATAFPIEENLGKAEGGAKSYGIDHESNLMHAAPTPHRKSNLCFLNLSSLFNAAIQLQLIYFLLSIRWKTKSYYIETTPPD